MKIITDLSHFEKLDYSNLVVALGNFDGVHLGHQAILEGIRKRAKASGGTSAVFTFREHPQRILHQKENPQILTSLVHKLHLLEASGIDLCFLVDFSIALSQKSPEDFTSEIFVETLGAKEVCLGFNARFGRGRTGDSQLMKQLAVRHGFTFVEFPVFRCGGQVVSSSAIRKFVGEGALDEAEKLLGRRYSFFGNVISGAGRGKQFGIPTVNLDPLSEVMPPTGVYAVWVRILTTRIVETQTGQAVLKEVVVKDRVQALMNYGRRPTFGDLEKPVPEIHILDYHPSLSSETVEVIIGERLRAERAFENVEALKNQIKTDISQGQQWFAKQEEKCH